MPWYKGNLHCHSSRSDGLATPVNVARFYSFQGHDFMGLSDHNRLTPTSELACPSDLVPVPCCEFSGEARCHVLGVGVNRAVAPAPSRRRKPRAARAILQEGVDLILAAGGVPVVCHPVWHWTLGFEDIAALRECRHFEICNASPDCNAFPVPGYEPLDTLWDRLLTAGHRYCGLAADDAHEYFGPKTIRTPLGGRGYNVVKAPTLDARQIIEALRQGHFYATTGIELESYRVSRTRMTLSVRRQQQEHTVFQFFGSGGTELKRETGTQAVYRFRGDERYVRVRIASTCGYWAWTQPVFLDRLPEAVRWTSRD